MHLRCEAQAHSDVLLWNARPAFVPALELGSSRCILVQGYLQRGIIGPRCCDEGRARSGTSILFAMMTTLLESLIVDEQHEATKKTQPGNARCRNSTTSLPSMAEQTWGRGNGQSVDTPTWMCPSLASSLRIFSRLTCRLRDARSMTRRRYLPVQTYFQISWANFLPSHRAPHLIQISRESDDAVPCLFKSSRESNDAVPCFPLNNRQTSAQGRASFSRVFAFS